MQPSRFTQEQKDRSRAAQSFGLSLRLAGFKTHVVLDSKLYADADVTGGDATRQPVTTLNVTPIRPDEPPPNPVESVTVIVSWEREVTVPSSRMFGIQVAGGTAKKSFTVVLIASVQMVLGMSRAELDTACVELYGTLQGWIA